REAPRRDRASGGAGAVAAKPQRLAPYNDAFLVVQPGGLMRRTGWVVATACIVLASAWIVRAAADKVDRNRLVTGQAAFVDYRSMKGGTSRKITVADLPQPYATESARNNARIVPRPADAWPQALAGFKVELYASELQGPRTIRQAPNGDLFVAETRAGN